MTVAQQIAELAEKPKHRLFHASFNDIEALKTPEKGFGIHVGTEETARERLHVKANEMRNTGEFEYRDTSKGYLYELSVSYNNPIKLKEFDRLDTWSAESVLRRFYEHVEDGNEQEVDISYEEAVETLELEEFVMPEEADNEFSGVDYLDLPEFQQGDFVTGLLKHYGFDAIEYENQYEGGGVSVLLLEADQVEITNKTSFEFIEKHDVSLNKSTIFKPSM